MVKLKAGGIVLGGIAAYLILSKGIGAVERGIRNMCVAHEWKNYYKYGKDGNMVPPGYASHTRQINDKEEYVVESPEQMEASKKQVQQNASNKGVGAQFAEAIVKAVADAFGGEKKAKEASEGQEKASEEDTYICPQNCQECEIPVCPYEHLKNGGVITQWRTDNGQPVSGRYPWGKDEELYWNVVGTSPTEENSPEEDKDNNSITDEEMENMMMEDLKEDIAKKGFDIGEDANNEANSD